MATQGSLERAADWLFSHMDDLPAAVASALGSTHSSQTVVTPAEAPLSDGSGLYELVSFISHMGANTACGHYVCHIKKEGSWALFNDRKVAASESTPRELGYIYLYQRKD